MRTSERKHNYVSEERLAEKPPGVVARRAAACMVRHHCKAFWLCLVLMAAATCGVILPGGFPGRFKFRSSYSFEMYIAGDPLKLFLYLNEIGGAHGVGRIDIVENRFVGMKSRGCYETPGGTVLHAATRDLETLTIDREVMRIRDTLSIKFAELVYNGFWFSPEMGMLNAAMDYARQPVTGSVELQLHKGNVICRGRSSPLSLYNKALVSMDEEGGFVPEYSTGFIQTLSTRLKASKAREALAEK